MTRTRQISTIQRGMSWHFLHLFQFGLGKSDNDNVFVHFTLLPVGPVITMMMLMVIIANDIGMMVRILITGVKY